jgi:ATP-dependent Clp protease ATP-binding subunit ClpA
LELNKVATRLGEHQIVLDSTEAARFKMAELGYDPEMGARPLKRVIQNKVEDRLSDGLLSGEFKDNDKIMIEIEGEEVILRVVKPEPEDEPQEVLPTG